jgi:4-hydroxybenzoate polyprenyltransferase
MEGDKVRGRKTVPLLYGEALARYSLATMIMLWSVLCPTLFPTIAWWGWMLPCIIGGTIAALTLLQKGLEVDELTWRLWCLWVAAMYTLPLYTYSLPD